METTTTRKFHPVAELLPLMQGAEFDALVQDIRENGLIEPIWIHPDDGSVLDGRNRVRACDAAGVELRTRTWNGKGSLVSFVISMNVKRRHLTKDELTHIAMEALPFYAKEAEARKLAGKTEDAGGRGNKKTLASFEAKVLDTGKAAAAAAAAVGISRTRVERARAVQQVPELYKKVVKGEMTFAKAARMIETKTKDRAPVARHAVAPEPKVPDQRTLDLKARLRAGVLSLADGRTHTHGEIERALGGACRDVLRRLTMIDWLAVVSVDDGKYEFVVDAALEAVCTANQPQLALGNLSAYTFLKSLRKQIIARREKDLAALVGTLKSEDSMAFPLVATLNWIEDEFDKVDVSCSAPLYTTLKDLRKEVTRKREEAFSKRCNDAIGSTTEFSSARKLNPILDLIEITLAGLDINPLGRD